MRLIEKLLKTSAEFKFDLKAFPRLSESLNHLKTKSFDIILLDLTLPDSDRESTLEDIKTKNMLPKEKKPVNLFRKAKILFNEKFKEGYLR